MDSGRTDSEGSLEGKAVPKKIIVIAVVGVILCASGLYVWYNYYRHWSISELESAVIAVETEYDYPNALGFEHRLAGRTVIVEGTVTGTETRTTTLGQLTFVYLEGGTFCGLILWDSPVPEDGSRLEVPVTFEWGSINGVEGVYSPQTTLPGFGILASVQVVTSAVSWVQGELDVEMIDTGDEVVVNLRGCPEPLPLGMARCSLMSGMNTGTIEYLDIMGEYSDNPCLDTIPDMASGAGVNGTILFEDDDGYLDGGDSFRLRNLSRPDTASGAQTYLLSVKRDLYPFEDNESYFEKVLSVYIIMTMEGVLWVEGPAPGVESAIISSHHSTLPDGEAFTVDYVSGELSWNGSVILLHDGTAAASWYVPLGLLDSGSPETQPLGVRTLGDLSVEIVVSDLAGNGLIDVGDRMEAVARDGTSFEAGVRYSFRVDSQATDAPALGEDFVYLAGPVSECTLSASEELASAVFGPVHNGTGEDYEDVDVVWGEVLVRLGSEGDSIEWHLATEDLWGDGQTSWVSNESALDGVTMTCSVLDLQGNGAVDAGDAVEIAVLQTGGAFDPDAEYTVSFVYLPTGSAIYTGTFAGAP
ncbi:MAG: hypothetical protein AB1793_09310 [Candidatus Thermoplasmatota archaeon]